MMAQQCCCLLFKILESILKYIGDQTELPAVDQEYLTPEINMRADRDQLGLTQHAVNKLREVRLTLFGLYRKAVSDQSPGLPLRQPWDRRF